MHLPWLGLIKAVGANPAPSKAAFCVSPLVLVVMSFLALVLTAESTTYRQKSGFSIDGEVFSVGTGGIIFRTSEGRLTARVPLSELEESDIAADPKVVAYLERQEQLADATAKAAAAAENIPVNLDTNIPAKNVSSKSAPKSSGTQPRASAQPQVPPTPAPGDFLHDFANVLDTEDERPIRELQQRTFAGAKIPIVVVTIRRMAEYQSGASYIETFARRWFDTWGIGSQANNSGMLVLVSIEDRKARIQLGAEWGRRFDEFSQRLMDQKMVPRFKEGAYGAGVLAAVRSLAEIAAAGPKAAPPSPSLTERILENPVVKFNRENNPIAQFLGPWILNLMIVAGVGFLVAAGFSPKSRKGLLIAGLAFIGIGALFWIILAILKVSLLAWVLKNADWSGSRGRSDRHDRSGGGGYGGGGGGFEGGSSGGGGASGSW